MSVTQPHTTRVQWTRRDDPVLPARVECARFVGRSGVAEIHLMVQPTQYAAFNEQLKWLRQAYREALDEMGISASCVVWQRYFCSDIANQATAREPTRDGEVCAESWVGQSPLGVAKVGMWVYAIHDPAGILDKKLHGDTLTLQRGTCTHHWTTKLTCVDAAGADEQTVGVFERYEEALRQRKLRLADDVLRTWLFVRDIDADYGALADARREYFLPRELTPKTHYIASTGIEGASPLPAAKVLLDAYAVGGLSKEQVTYVRVPDQLSATDLYGVTFERATTVDYADRRHVLVSGTASIDQRGELIHAGDVAGQLGRTLENIEALLQEAGASHNDLGVLIAYVRDGRDAHVVEQGIRERWGNVPLMVVEGAVCRPGWLVEVEGQALMARKRDDLAAF